MFSPLFFTLFNVLCFTYGANLPPEELQSLQVTTKVLGMSHPLSDDPCSQPIFLSEASGSGITCDCSYVNGTSCHILKIVLEDQNLTGSLPRELAGLPFLQEISLDRNYLNGTIPPEWGSMNLQTISLLGNSITGTIPTELANISTLKTLNLEFNQLSGSIPRELGNLPQLEIIAITSNNLTGELPESLGRLTTLKEFRIGDNNFTGRIPTFIYNWTNIDQIFIQASGLTGPIPDGIASLTKLTDLRISDLSGNESTFPALSGLKDLTTLILRSCNIVGSLPSYIGEMTTLTVLDLSFNRLNGPIPDTFVGLSATCNYIYLTGNSLTGSLPNWMRAARKSIDLSYNNLTNEPSNSTCQFGKLNLFASTDGNTTGTVSCLRSLGCQPKYYLRINCGGGEVRNGRGITYETDVYSIGGSSNFIWSPQKSNWGLSNTGHFMDSIDTNSYTARKESNMIGPDSHLYMDARVSPLSLTYAGCLHNGKYTVKLHFAEIVLTGDKIGRRIFDVYIQRSLVLKEFNIEEEAGGVGRPITRNFTVDITDTTLDIRFYWAGKGTTGIPRRGIYGPLISAISVDPNFAVPAENGKRIPGRIITIGIVAGVVGVLFTVVLVMGISWWKGCLKRESTLEDDLRGLKLQTGAFTLRKIKAATNNFDSANKIGEGGFGPVYKGHMSDGTAIAVKQLSSKSKQGNREFLNEIGMISAVQHPNLVKLYGCCIEGNQLLLVYEYLENNSLSRALFGPTEHQLNMDWSTRHKICIDIARGLAYLHEESRLKIVHRDIKAANVLLDKDLTAKISDFGLAKLDEEDNTHMSTRVAGTYGYMAPEYAMRGHLTEKADVYSFGVVTLEVVSGRMNRSMDFNLLKWAISLNENGDLMELVDPRLESKFSKEEVLATINVALHCTNVVSTDRPTMSAVVSILEGKTVLPRFLSNLSTSFDTIQLV